MPKLLTSSLSIEFSSGLLGGLRLVEDSSREVPPLSRNVPGGGIVSCTNAKFVRLYPPRESTTVVVAATGMLAYVGEDTEHDSMEIMTFSPTEGSADINRGAKNIRIEAVGVAFDAVGKQVSVSVTYDSVRRQIVVTPAAYCVIKVLYDADYSLYRYTFSGSCPDKAPKKFDAQGNALNPLVAETPKYFDDGLLSAIDPAYASYTSLHLDPPECAWTSVATNFLDSDKDKVVPALKLEIDPDYPIRLVAGGTTATAECCIRCYPAGAAASTLSTAGVLSLMQSGLGAGVRQILEVKDFTNAAVASLEYPPAGSIQASPIGTLKSLGDGFGGFIKGPGDTVIDVTYIDKGNGRYTDPRPRVLGPNELAVVDLFNHPVPSYGMVQVAYSSLFDRYLYIFDLVPGGDGSLNFTPASAIFTDALGRAAHIKLDPPSLKDKTRSAQGGVS